MSMQGSLTPKARFNTGYLLVATIGVLWLHGLWVQATGVAQIPYSEFQQLLRDRQVKEVVVWADRIQGELTDDATREKRRFVTTRVEPDIAAELDRHGVRYAGRIKSQLIPTLLSWIVPALVFFGIWALLVRRFAGRMAEGGGMLTIGKSKAKVYVETGVKTTFADVAGADEAKAELEEIVAFLKDRETAGRLGARPPKGVLLVGPPGTGKTLLARAVAGEAGVPFFSISGSEFVEMFVGVGAARVRDLFEQARSQAPCIIFVDELDALGRARGVGGLTGGHDEKEQTLNQLLVEMDGFDPTSGIVLLAATNRPEVLDPALLRAGRFDRQVLVDRPDRLGRAAILRVYLRKVTPAADVDAERIAALTPGFTGADLANLVNEAAIVATRRGAAAVALADFTAGVERIVAGLEKRNRLLSAREREIVAYHEMGHALVAAAIPGADPVHKISIIPRGIGALGYTLQRPTEDRYLMTREELEDKMAVLLGGRAAEHLIFDHLSTGAADDIARATDIARSMVTRYGMVESMGHVVYQRETVSYLATPAADAGGRLYSEATACEIDRAVRDIVGAAFERARGALAARRELLEEGARRLLERETLEEADLRPLFERARMVGRPSAPARAAGAEP